MTKTMRSTSYLTLYGIAVALTGMDARRFEWDEAKDAANDAKHGIRFVDAATVFSDPRYLKEDSSRPEHGEERRKAIGTVSGRVIAVIFTYRHERLRIISARRARPDERAHYDQSKPTS